MAARRGLALVVLVVVAGLVLGSLLGEVLGALLPSGRLQALLTQGPTFGLTPPATLDLRLLSLTIGFALKVNLVGVVGIVVSALVLRRLG
ncbi:MAG: DUF4321 domain-containing protein [Candidatus Rokuibacteriota bacterium]